MNQKLTLKNEKFNFILIFALTCIILFFSLKDNFLEVVNQINSLNLIWLLLAILLVFGYWCFSSMSMHLVAKQFKKGIKFNKILRLNIITQFFNGITPFASGGQPYQIYALKKEKINIVDSTNVSIGTFVTYQIALILLGTIAIILNKIFVFFPDIKILKIFVIIGYFLNLLVGVGLFSISFMKKFNKYILSFIAKLLKIFRIIKDKNQLTDKFDNYVNRFNEGTRILLQDKRNFILSILFQLCGLISLYLVPLSILFSMNDFTSFNAGVSIVASSYVMIIGAFVPLPGGTGGLEYSFINFYGNFVSGGKLTVLMLMWRFVTYYFGMIVGAILLNLNRRKK